MANTHQLPPIPLTAQATDPRGMISSDWVRWLTQLVQRVNAIAPSGLIPWANVLKGGSSLADLETRSASDLSSGRVALARGGTNADLSATGGTGQVLKQSAAGAAVTVGALTPGDLPSGIPWAKIDKTGSSLGDLTTRSASDLSSGTLPDGRFPATLPAISGANLTNLDASDLATGTVPDARLSANVARRDQNNTFDAGSGNTTLEALSGTGSAALLATTTDAGSSAQFAAQSQDGQVLSFGRDNSGAAISMGASDAYLEIIGPSSQGLLANWYRFPATQVASANANTLDDYEEGSWTPVLTFATPGDLAVTYSIQVARYAKIGNTVRLTWTLTLSSFTHTTASGQLRLTGLPFVSDNIANLFSLGAIQFSGITKAGYTQATSQLAPNASVIVVSMAGSGVGAAAVVAADMPSGGTVNLSGSLVYQAQ